MESTDMIFACLLCFSVGFGYVAKQIEAGRLRELVSSATGVCMVAILCGSYGFHSVVIVLVNAAIIVTLQPSIVNIASFIWCFGYLLFFRTTSYFGLAEVPSYADGTQLLITLKLVGLAFEISDSSSRKKQIERDEASEEEILEFKYREVNPGFLDVLLYSYCYIGILTGPYYKYRTYIDMMNNKNTDKIEINSHLIKTLKWLPLVSILILTVPALFPIEYTQSAEIFERSLWYRAWYTFPMFLQFRMRLYFAWIMAECICFTSTLGAYPKASLNQPGFGPKDIKALRNSEKEDRDSVEYDFKTIDCLNINEIEGNPTFRGAMRAWNMTIQYWMAHHVYKRFPIRPLRTVATFCVSAYWHGIYSGYYLSFFTIAFGFVAEGAMRAAFRSGASPRGQRLFDWFWWIVMFRVYEYASIPFLIRSWNEIITYCNSVYFYGNISMVAFLILGKLVIYSKGKGSRKNRENKTDDSQTYANNNNMNMSKSS